MNWFTCFAPSEGPGQSLWNENRTRSSLATSGKALLFGLPLKSRDFWVVRR
jgi:hypothetical protein